MNCFAFKKSSLSDLLEPNKHRPFSKTFLVSIGMLFSETPIKQMSEHGEIKSIIWFMAFDDLSPPTASNAKSTEYSFSESFFKIINSST